jgi:hypothetical protein
MAMKWSNAGHHKFFGEQLYFYKEKINRNLLLEQNYIPPSTLRNILVVAIKVNETDWAKSFLETYIEKLPKQYYNDSYNYAWGYYYYHAKNYDKALEHLSQTDNMEDVMSNILARKLYLKCYYEHNSQATSHLMSSQAAFDKYLLRHKQEIGTRINLLKPFVKYFGKLIACNKEDANNILQQLQTENYFPDKEWLETMLKKRK